MLTAGLAKVHNAGLLLKHIINVRRCSGQIEDSLGGLWDLEGGGVTDVKAVCFDIINDAKIPKAKLIYVEFHNLSMGRSWRILATDINNRSHPFASISSYRLFTV